jgi:hypothetical protein
MQAIITVFKTEFKGKEQLPDQLQALAKTVKDLDDVMIYRPHAGKLIIFLTFLNENNIAYGTHFNTLAEGE